MENWEQGGYQLGFTPTRGGAKGGPGKGEFRLNLNYERAGSGKTDANHGLSRDVMTTLGVTRRNAGKVPERKKGTKGGGVTKR